MKTTNIFSTALTPVKNTSITPNPAHKIRKIHRFLSRGTLTLNDLILNYCHLEGSKPLLLLALQEKENVLKRCLWKTHFKHTAKKPHSLPRKHPCAPLRTESRSVRLQYLPHRQLQRFQELRAVAFGEGLWSASPGFGESAVPAKRIHEISGGQNLANVFLVQHSPTGVDDLCTFSNASSRQGNVVGDANVAGGDAFSDPVVCDVRSAGHTNQ